MKLAIITGASAGIGRQLAHLFAADGINLALVARRKEKLEEVQSEILAKYAVEILVIPIDLTSSDAIQHLVSELEEHDITHLVNNAGFGTNGLFWELEREKELRQIALNITALTNLTHQFLPKMIERNHGYILNIASTAAFQPGPYMSVYYATKAYVLAFSEGLAGELSHTNVSLTAHCPGATFTEFADLAGVGDKLLFKKGAASVEVVAKHAYQSMQKEKVVAIQGILNWLLAFSIRLSPRFIVRYLTKFINK